MDRRRQGPADTLARAYTHTHTHAHARTCCCHLSTAKSMWSICSDKASRFVLASSAVFFYSLFHERFASESNSWRGECRGARRVLTRPPLLHPLMFLAVVAVIAVVIVIQRLIMPSCNICGKGSGRADPGKKGTSSSAHQQLTCLPPLPLPTGDAACASR